MYDVNFSIILFDPKGYFLFQVAGVPLHTQFSSQDESERDKAKIITHNQKEVYKIGESPCTVTL